jgi:exoribonuclease R
MGPFPYLTLPLLWVHHRWRVWAHVADPTAIMHKDDALVDAARARGSTIYLPYAAVPMFPWALAAGPFSLLRGRENRALSFGLDVDEAGVPTGEVVMCASRVNVTCAPSRLTTNREEREGERERERERERETETETEKERGRQRQREGDRDREGERETALEEGESSAQRERGSPCVC